MEKEIRLDRYLADAGFGSRSVVKKLIRQGAVLIDGQPAANPETKISGAHHVVCNGFPVQRAPSFVYYLLHKPAGVITATRDSHTATVLDLVPSDSRRNLFPVGRLDKDTEGLLLITDDGAFAHQLLSPANHVDKTYYALLRGSVTQEHVNSFAKGIDIRDPLPTRPARLEILSVFSGSRPPILKHPPSFSVIWPEEPCSEILLTIQEGRFHQVKRMAEAIGCEVLYLKRLSMGPYMLPENLPCGAFLEVNRQIE